MMKRKYLLLLIIFYQMNFGQSACGINNISTNPVSPFNQLDPNYLNYFDWTTSSSSYAINSTCSLNSFTTNPFQSNQVDLLPLSLSKDMMPKDGWEVVAYNLGFDNNNVPLSVRPEHTYLMLYNKYTGILRILVKWCRNQNYNGSLLTLKFAPGFQTNVLDMANDEKALDAPHVVNPSLSSALKFYNDNTSWSYADFKLNYDPCTCSFNESARLALYTELITNSSIKLSGQITGDITSITNGQGVANSDGNFWKSAGSVNDNMMKVHKGLKSFKNDYAKIYKDLSDNGVTINAINKVGDFLTNNKFMKAGLAAFPYVSKAFKFIGSFLGGGVDGSAGGPIELAPLSVNLDVQLKGTIATSDPMHNVTIGLPGSQKQNVLKGTSGGQPLYNETLGVFSLINTPVMYYTDYSNCDVFNLTSPWSSCPGGRRYRLSGETLKYAINPASNLELQDAQVMIVVEYIKPAVVYLKNKLLYDSGVSLFDLNVKNGLEIAGTSKGPMVDDEKSLFQNAFEPIDLKYFKNDYSFAYKYEDYGTPNFGGMFPGAEIDKGFLDPKVRNFKLKFILNFKRTDNPDAQNVLHVVTYPIQLKPAPVGYQMNGSNYVNDALIYANQGTSNIVPANKIIRINQNELDTFCSGMLYKNNRFSTTAKFAKIDIQGENLDYDPESGLISKVENKPVLYPVPVRNILNIKSNACELINISNIFGAIVIDKFEKKKSSDDSIVLDMSKLVKGLYFLKYKDNLGGINNVKFVVE